VITIFKTHRGKRSRAQGMVEFALALPVFLLVILGIIEFSRLFLTYSSVYTASRDAVRFAVATGISSAGVPNYQDCNGIRDAGMNLGRFGGVGYADFDIRYDQGLVEIPDEFTSLQQCSGATSNVNLVLGDRVLVKVETVFRPIVPIVNIPPIPVSSTTARTILSGVNIRGTLLPTSTRINTYTPTITYTPTDTPTPTLTFTPTPVYTPTDVPTATEIPTETTIPTVGPSPTPTDTSTVTITPTPTITTTPTATPTVTLTPVLKCSEAYVLTFSSRSDTTYVFQLDDFSNRPIGEYTTIRSIKLTWYKPVLLIAYYGPYTNWFPTESPGATSPWDHPFPAETAYIVSGSSNRLEFYFDGVYEIDPFIEVALNDNCLLSYGYIPPTPTPTRTPTPTLTPTRTATLSPTPRR
jgi:hypothetical protein